MLPLKANIKIAGMGLNRIDVYGQYMRKQLNWFIMVPYLTLNMGFVHQTNRDIPSVNIQKTMERSTIL